MSRGDRTKCTTAMSRMGREMKQLGSSESLGAPSRVQGVCGQVADADRGRGVSG